MTILVRKALIVDPQSNHHNTVKDILITDGIITGIDKNLSAQADQVIEGKDLLVSRGWIDMFAHFNDPGNEQKESLESGANAAAAGGFTSVCIVPNTNPVIDTKAQVEYLVQKSRTLPVDVLPLGAVTKKAEGKELAEMYDMKQSGAIAFSDGTYPLQSAGLMVKALQYVKAFDGAVIQVPNDKSISTHGLMNEGITSTRLGLPGIPAIAEEILIRRDIDLVRYTGSRLHITGVSTAKGLDLVKAAKAEGLNVTCSVTPYHLNFSEEDLTSYDTNLKVSPPLRTRQDVAALKEGVLNGDVDCIATHHFPQHWDNKVCEFEYAKDGMIGLESAFSLVNTALPGLSNERLAELFGLNAAAILKIATIPIEKNNNASLTLFTRNTRYTFEMANVRSRSSNTPVAGMPLTGKVIGIINKGKVFLN